MSFLEIFNYVSGNQILAPLSVVFILAIIGASYKKLFKKPVDETPKYGLDELDGLKKLFEESKAKGENPTITPEEYEKIKKDNADFQAKLIKLYEEKEKSGEAVAVQKEEFATLQKETIALQRETINYSTKLKEASLMLGQKAAKIALEGKVAVAREKFEEAISIYPEVTVLNLYGHYLRRIGELDLALKQYKKVVEVGVQTENEELKAIGYGNIGTVHQTKGELDEALEFYNKALTIDEDMGNKEGTAIGYGNIGVIYDIRNKPDKALEFYNKALAIDGEMGNKEGMASNYGNIGNVYNIKGELDEALEFYNKSLAINENMGRKEGMANQYGNIGNVYVIKGELDEALEFYNKARDLFFNVGITPQVAKADRFIADIEAKLKNQKLK